MSRRQSMPDQWLIIERGADAEHWKALTDLPRGSGVLALQPLHARAQRQLRRVATARELTVCLERPRGAGRVHNQAELTRALLRRAEPILISPIHPTDSHPDWQPLPRMRAAALARLAGRRAIALGGMNRERYAKVASLGFIGWAGISAFRT